MEKAFELKYDATSEEARAQVQAYLNEVGKRIKEINEHEERVIDEARKLEFLQEDLPELENDLLTTIGCINDRIDRCCHLDDLENLNVEELKKTIHILKFEVGHAIGCVTDAIEAVRLLKWATENFALEYSLKRNMLDECTHFQMKHWQLTENS